MSEDAVVLPPEEQKRVEEETTKALSVPATEKRPIKIGERGAAFESVSEAYALAQGFVKAGTAPLGATAGDVLASILKGRSLGVDEVTAMTEIRIVKGRVILSGTLILAIIRRSGLAKEVEYWWDGDDKLNERVAYVKTRRADQHRPVITTFSQKDALRAGLLNNEKKPSYRTFTDDMLLWRAVSRVGRREFPELCAGVYVHGEIPEVEGEPQATAGLERPGLPPPAADPLIDAVAPTKAAEVPLVNAEASPAAQPPPDSPPPFASHAEADKAIAEKEHQGRLFDRPKGKRKK